MSQLDDQPLSADETDPAEVARLHRRTAICVWIILIGLANFLAYVIGYSYLWGEANHGHVYDMGDRYLYVLQSGAEVSRCAFIYSGIHSISIWLTVGAVMLAMLTLAKERIASSMRVTIIRGRTLMTVLATVITITIVSLTIVSTLRFIDKFRKPEPPPADPPAVTQPNDAVS